MPRTRILVTLMAALAAVFLTQPAGAVSVGAAPGFDGLAAAAASCPDQDDPAAAVGAQVRAMRCLVNATRRDRGLSPLSAARGLDRAAARKSADILRCDEFDHQACGRSFTYWIVRSGYRACRAAENIAWGTGALGAPSAIFRSWMGSLGHRRNILGPYAEIGIGLRFGDLEGNAGAHVWTQNFGSRDC